MKKLTLVGAGCGDPDLITLKGVKALQNADAILYDALANEALLAHARPDAVKIFVGKRRGKQGFLQEEINNLIVECVEEYGHVVRLKGGDPYVFGRGFEEILFAQQHGIETAYVPGISSAIAAAGLVGIPVTHRGASQSFWVVTATAADESLPKDLTVAAQSDATVIVLMGLAKIKEIAQVFIDNGKSNLPVAVIQNGSLPTEKTAIGTVETIAQVIENEQIIAPAILIFGNVVNLLQPRANEFARY
jgi:uroporphyrin-III C-methyltransferase